MIYIWKWQSRRKAEETATRIMVGEELAGGTCQHPHMEAAAAAPCRQRRLSASLLARLPPANRTSLKASAGIFTSRCWVYNWLENFWQNNVSAKETILLKLTHFTKRRQHWFIWTLHILKNEQSQSNSMLWKQLISTLPLWFTVHLNITSYHMRIIYVGSILTLKGLSDFTLWKRLHSIKRKHFDSRFTLQFPQCLFIGSVKDEGFQNKMGN